MKIEKNTNKIILSKSIEYCSINIVKSIYGFNTETQKRKCICPVKPTIALDTTWKTKIALLGEIDQEHNIVLKFNSSYLAITIAFIENIMGFDMLQYICTNHLSIYIYIHMYTISLCLARLYNNIDIIKLYTISVAWRIDKITIDFARSIIACHIKWNWINCASIE